MISYQSVLNTKNLRANMPLNLDVIAFDADDTLWVNEPYFREAELAFCKLMQAYITEEACMQALFDVEMKNLPLYGYGIKPFTLSLVEAAISFSKGRVSTSTLKEIIALGKAMLHKPVEVIEGIPETLEILSKKYRLVMATKGDLLDQERKLVKSGLADFFHHIEIVSDKTQTQYRKLIKIILCYHKTDSYNFFF